MIAAAVCRGVGARDTDAVGAGPLATGCSTDACCDGSATGMSAGSGAVTCGGTTTTRRSGASMRRSCQGKPKPGRHNPWPPKIRLNRNEWISSESSSAFVSRLCSGLMCWLSARCWNLWNSSVLRRSCSGTAAGAGQEGTMSCAPVDLTGPPVTTSPNQHLGDIREPHPVHCHAHLSDLGVDSHMSERTVNRGAGSSERWRFPRSRLDRFRFASNERPLSARRVRSRGQRALALPESG